MVPVAEQGQVNGVSISRCHGYHPGDFRDSCTAAEVNVPVNLLVPAEGSVVSSRSKDISRSLDQQ